MKQADPVARRERLVLPLAMLFGAFFFVTITGVSRAWAGLHGALVESLSRRGRGAPASGDRGRCRHAGASAPGTAGGRDRSTARRYPRQHLPDEGRVSRGRVLPGISPDDSLPAAHAAGNACTGIGASGTRSSADADALVAARRRPFRTLAQIRDRRPRSSGSPTFCGCRSNSRGVRPIRIARRCLLRARSSCVPATRSR